MPNARSEIYNNSLSRSGLVFQNKSNNSLVASRLFAYAHLVRAFVGDYAFVILMTMAFVLPTFDIAFYLD
jgi:hypothetical protein